MAAQWASWLQPFKTTANPVDGRFAANRIKRATVPLTGIKRERGPAFGLNPRLPPQL